VVIEKYWTLPSLKGCTAMFFRISKVIRGPLLIHFDPRPLAGEGRVRGLFLGFPVRFKVKEFRQVDF
jgi:hypothetical protein